MKISRDLYDEIVSHALADPRNEVCGVVATDLEAQHAVRVFRAVNVHASPMKFEIEPMELLRLNNACEELGKLGAIYHSHVRSAPYPSQTDINFAAGWLGVEWIIVGLAAGEEPDVRSYLIDGPEVQGVQLEIG